MSSYLGQNFLVDGKVKDYIAQKIEKIYKETGATTIIEIGPGKGAITRKICQIPSFFIAVEKDKKLIDTIRSLLVKGEVINEDILTWDSLGFLKSKEIDPKKTLIVGNLPYYITSPILTKFFSQAKVKYAGGFFMIQKEVGEKIATDAKKKSYLRWLINFAHTVIYKRTVGKKSFSPAPNVTSCLIQIHGKREEEKENGSQMYSTMIDVLNLISPYKRKTIAKIMKMLQKKKRQKNEDFPEEIGEKRLEALNREDIEKIGTYLKEIIGK